MKNKSIFKASFEESLNLLDDSVSGKYAEDLYQDALKKRKIQRDLEVICLANHLNTHFCDRA